MQRFEVPAPGDKFGCQPVEQLGMGGRLAHATEITRCAGQSLAKMILPDAIDDHAG